MALAARISQRQSIGAVPEHIIGKTMLKMGLQELQQFLQTQFAENPALTLADSAECPACHSLLMDGVCVTCGSQELTDDTDQTAADDDTDWLDDLPAACGEAVDDYREQFAGVATPRSLSDYLKEQMRADISEHDRPLAEFLIDSLDEDGYLREPLLDIASLFGRSVPEVEVVLRQLQSLDPPGVAARDLRECLSIQLSRLTIESEDRRHADTLVRDHWDSISRMRLDEAAAGMGVSKVEVESAMVFMRESLNPHPAAMFRDPWQEFTPRRVPRAAPDLVVRTEEDGPEIDVVDPVSGGVAIDMAYAGLHAEMTADRNALSEEERAHVREFVNKAKAIIEAVEFRKSTLRKVADEILRCQASFFTEGASALKPMTRKQLAQAVGVHESTVCRVTQDKTLRLPSGDVIPLDVLFDSALPVKEMVRQLAAQRLSDSDIAKRLGEAGIQVARRTVAKYRDQLRVLPVGLRLAA